MTILETYQRRHKRSAELFEQARQVFPDGVTHDTRRFTPFPIYVERAQGPRKWDVDGNELIDYVSGHGSLLLGHGRSEVVEAVREQVVKGTHLGASHETEIEWGRWVQRLVPAAERVRFTSSGTEAVQMAVRLARASTKRELLIKFESHFHGWSDTVSALLAGNEGVPFGVGIPEGALGAQIILPVNDVAALERTLADHEGEVAAIIIEPTGASMGSTPADPDFLFELRRLTERDGIVLIFDEVVTGFRIAPGGAQAHYGVTPDLTTLAKILAGGLPGGAVAGKADLLGQIGFTDSDGSPRGTRVSHPGTFNANPISAAAGVAALAIVATGDPHRAANAAAERLATEMNRIIRRHEVAGCVYGQQSLLHILLGKEAQIPDDGYAWQWTEREHRTVPHTAPETVVAFRRAMINEGVDPMGPRLIVSAAHDPEAVEFTVAAFDRAVGAMQEEGLL
ncbi:MAG: aminotransferase class III-fold pyridoxal phosphate-dependent enzyme [Chloroflexi bacterium]|nr:aminotransferase class III-fold pyridoxal phosphate-dependent enzyme [Chloroflexota bacterium]